nr:hypothetical protein 92 [bacterium]
MLVVKVHQEKSDRADEFDKTIENISGHIRENLSLQDVKMLSDNHCVEIISGKDEIPSDDDIVAELVIRKTIVINKNAISDRESLDRFITNIKHFCDQAKEIEDSSYLPLHMR